MAKLHYWLYNNLEVHQNVCMYGHSEPSVQCLCQKAVTVTIHVSDNITILDTEQQQHALFRLVVIFSLMLLYYCTITNIISYVKLTFIFVPEI